MKLWQGFVMQVENSDIVGQCSTYLDPDEQQSHVAGTEL